MKRQYFKKLGIEGASLYGQSRIISYFLFFLPFTVIAYICYEKGALQSLDFAQVAILSLILLPPLAVCRLLLSGYRARLLRRNSMLGVAYCFLQ